MDDLPALVRQILKFFVTTHPIRVGVGLCAGFAAKILFTVALAYFPSSPVLMALNALPVYYFSLAIVSVIMGSIALGHRGAPERVGNQINTIDALLDKAGMSPPQRRFIYHSLVHKYLSQLDTDLRKTRIDLVKEGEREILESPDNTPEPE